MFHIWGFCSKKEKKERREGRKGGIPRLDVLGALCQEEPPREQGGLELLNHNPSS